MRHSQRGNALLLVIIAFATLFAVIGLSLEHNGDVAVSVKKHHLETAALNLAESGIAYAFDKMYTSDNFYGEESFQLDPVGTCTVSITQLTPSNKIEILTIGRATGTGSRLSDAVRTIRMVIQRAEEGTEEPFILLSREIVL
jgi:hypothetical protein